MLRYARGMDAQSDNAEVAPPVDLAVLAASIADWARELGFGALGVSDADLGDAPRRLADWIAAGRHGTMDYMARHGVTVTRLCSALGSLAFSFECVFHWPDAWLPLHREAPDPAWLAGLTEPPANPAARELVAALRAATVAFFRDIGAASNQIGRTYPYVDALAPATATLLRQLKTQLDPKGLMNPGVLGL